MEWVAHAEEYIGSFGWGARGKNLGISRMFGEGDISSLSRNKWFASYRPRGVLSGFLAILPNFKGVVFVPPIAAKVPPMRLRLRISDKLNKDGAVFSAYLTRDSPRKLILEDVLVWCNKPVWKMHPFTERWGKCMKAFVGEEFISDPELQKVQIELADYKSLASLTEPGDRSVVEFVPNDPSQKRLIWIPPPTATAAPTAATSVPSATATATAPTAPVCFTARKEVAMGPDVYAMYRSDERLGIALVRTLAISRALRTAGSDIINVTASYNKTFEKWEITGVL